MFLYCAYTLKVLASDSKLISIFDGWLPVRGGKENQPGWTSRIPIDDCKIFFNGSYVSTNLIDKEVSF